MAAAVTGEDEWSDWEDEDIPARSLFEDKLLPSAKARVVSRVSKRKQKFKLNDRARDCQLWWLGAG